MKVSFELTMPNVGSWNGKWTGASKKYFVIRGFRKKSIVPHLTSDNIKKLLGGHSYRSFYYNFGDGWGANVKMEIVDAAEANKRRKASAGFCGYEWMIDSILIHGEIIVQRPHKTTPNTFPSCSRLTLNISARR